MDSNIPSKVWDKIIHLIPNFNSAAIEAWEWINKLILHLMMEFKSIHVTKRGQR